MRALDDLLETILPVGTEIETDGGPAQEYAVETFSMARRSFGSVHLLMQFTIETDDHPAATDRTEDAAILGRRLLEFFARLAYINSEPAVAEVDRNVNALRWRLADARRLIEGIEKAIRLSVEEGVDPTDYEKNLAEWHNAADDIKAKLDENLRSRSTMKPRGITSILEDVSPRYALIWHRDSDVAHGGSIGRAMQRQDNTVGTPATAERRIQVIDTAIMAMIDVARNAGHILGWNTADIEAFADHRRPVL